MDWWKFAIFGVLFGSACMALDRWMIARAQPPQTNCVIVPEETGLVHVA